MILDQIVEDKKVRLIQQKKQCSLTEMRRRAEETEPYKASFKEALKRPGMSIIGEFKKASPSLGNIQSKIDLTSRIEEYNRSVDAISCLTEEDHFHGSVSYLQEIRSISPLPILRKDFMIDPYQFYEAKAIQANAILLIMAILSDEEAKDFYQLAKELGLDALVEVHNERELERAIKLDCEIIGVNNRNLMDFSIDLKTTEQLAAQMPEGKILVSESGILTDGDVRLLARNHVDAFLIGRAFMEAENPKMVADHWKQIAAQEQNNYN